jgi:hypothetical protein
MGVIVASLKRKQWDVSFMNVFLKAASDMRGNYLFLGLSFQSCRAFFNRLLLSFRFTGAHFFGDGFIYVRGLLLIFMTDALIVDDEPL